MQHLEAIAANALKQWRNTVTRYLLNGEVPGKVAANRPTAPKPSQWGLKQKFYPREISYLPALRVAMKTLIEQGEKPTAAMVLELWRVQKSKPILEVKKQYFMFEGVDQSPKRVERKDLQNAIDRQLIRHSKI